MGHARCTERDRGCRLNDACLRITVTAEEILDVVDERDVVVGSATRAEVHRRAASRRVQRELALAESADRVADRGDVGIIAGGLGQYCLNVGIDTHARCRKPDAKTDERHHADEQKQPPDHA